MYALPPGIIFFKRNKQPHILQQALLYLFIWSLASSDSLLFVGFFFSFMYIVQAENIMQVYSDIVLK